MSFWSRLFGRQRAVSTTEAIAHLFELHGIGVRRDPRESPGSCQLDFVMRLPDGRTLVESLGGFGKTPEALARDAVDNFTNSSLHVLLRGIVAPGRDPRSDRLPR